MIIEGSTNRAFVDYVYGELEGGKNARKKKVKMLSGGINI